LIAASFLFTCLLVWLTGTARLGADPRNTPENLLANSASINKLPPLSELKTNLSAEELAFGEEQMAKMLKDRPELGRYVSKADPIWQFGSRAFAGAAIGEPILWKSGTPGEGYRSESLGPFQGQQGYIRIRKTRAFGDGRGQLLSCEELWSCAVFEIENIRNHRAFDVLYRMALKGELTREEWIRENSRLEYGALRRTADDFKQLWLPMARNRSISITMSFWGADTPTTYEIWISQYRDPNSYPWDVFGRYYDRQIVPYVRNNRR
jgi:hypothetical protein